MRVSTPELVFQVEKKTFFHLHRIREEKTKRKYEGTKERFISVNDFSSSISLSFVSVSRSRRRDVCVVSFLLIFKNGYENIFNNFRRYFAYHYFRL